MGFIFFGAAAVFSVDACHLFPQCMLAVIPLIEGVTCGDQSLPCILSVASSFALWLSLLCQGPGLFLSYWSRSSQICFLAAFLSCVSELWFDGRWGWDWSVPAGRAATEYSSARVIHS